jgi:hypothetical protein
MENPLVLMAYPSASGKNVTISPRRCYSHAEPIYDSEIAVQAMPGTGLFNDTTYIFNGVCSNCRSWPSKGKIDISNTAQEMSYGTGPSGDIRSDDPRESVKVHWNYGSFTMDMVHATGTGGVPEIPASENVTSVGAVQQSAETGHVDTKAILHAVLMILAFVGMWPFGILVLRVGGSVRWHAINQGVAFGVVFIGAILGFIISPSYNRVSTHPQAVIASFRSKWRTAAYGNPASRVCLLTSLITEQKVQHGAPDHRHLRLHLWHCPACARVLASPRL